MVFRLIKLSNKLNFRSGILRSLGNNLLKVSISIALETVQHTFIFDVLCCHRAIIPLITIKAGLLPLDNVYYGFCIGRMYLYR